MNDITKSFRLAALIDADNVNPMAATKILAEIATLGVASVKRIYGDWTTPQLNRWKDVLLEHSIQPIQQFAYTSGKNATDSAMIIDAMDLLHIGHYDGFCLVSSDSDFTRLAVRLRESGKVVYGFGERYTPVPFVSACDRFIYTDVSSVKPKKISSQNLRQDTKLCDLLRNAIESLAEDGWADLGQLGGLIAKQRSDFDSSNYGYSKLGDLIKAIGLFDVRRAPNTLNTLLIRIQPHKVDEPI